MQKILCALVFMIMISTASANPCNLDLNTSTQQDYAAIVLAGCDPFAMLRQKRLGRARAQQLDDSVKAAFMMSAMTPSTSTGTTGSNSALNTLIGLEMADNDLAAGLMMAQAFQQPTDGTSGAPSNVMNSLIMADAIGRRLRSRRAQQVASTGQTANLDYKDIAMVNALSQGNNGGAINPYLYGMDEDLATGMMIQQAMQQPTAGASGAPATPNALIGLMVADEFELIDRRLRSPRVEQVPKNTQATNLDMKDYFYMANALSGGQQNIGAAMLLADEEDAAMMAMMNQNVAPNSNTPSMAQPNSMMHAAIMSEAMDSDLPMMMAGMGTGAGNNTPAANNMMNAAIMSEAMDSDLPIMMAGMGTGAGNNAPAANNMMHAAIMSEVMDSDMPIMMAGMTPGAGANMNTFAQAAMLSEGTRRLRKPRVSPQQSQRKLVPIYRKVQIQ